MKLLNKLLLLTLVLAATLNMTSCKKDNQGAQQGSGNVRVKLARATYNTDSKSNAKQSSSQAVRADEPQRQVIPLGNGMSIVATLTVVPDDTTATATIGHKRAGSTKKADAVQHSQALQPGTRYRVVVYNPNGTYNTHHDYTYGTDDEIGFDLDGGITYTFVAYSINSTTTLPRINNTATGETVADEVTTTPLANAQVSVTDSEASYLMYFKDNMQVSADQDHINYLEVELAHQFAQVTPTVRMESASSTLGARVMKIVNPVFKPMRSSATIDLEDGDLAYGAVKPAGITAQFGTIPTAGISSITGTPVNIIAPETSTGTLELENLTLALGQATNNVETGPFVISKSPSDIPTPQGLTITGLELKPGYRYNLNLEYKSCIVISQEEDFFWNMQATPGNSNNPISTQTNLHPTDIWTLNASPIGRIQISSANYIRGTYTFNSSDFGAVIDIYALDNSLNLNINGTDLTTAELQLQPPSAQPLGVNLKFIDEAATVSWGNSGIPHIYNIHGPEVDRPTFAPATFASYYVIKKPILRFTITKDGGLDIYAIKTYANSPNYELVPLEFKANQADITPAFNNVTWNTGSNNTVVMRQYVWGSTRIAGTVTGYKIDCTP